MNEPATRSCPVGFGDLPCPAGPAAHEAVLGRPPLSGQSALRPPVPTLKSGDVVIIYNLKRHHFAGVREALEAADAMLRYLPQYSPDPDPIELAFAKLKALLRKAARPVRSRSLAPNRLCHPNLRNAQFTSAMQDMLQPDRNLLLATLAPVSVQRWHPLTHQRAGSPRSAPSTPQREGGATGFPTAAAISREPRPGPLSDAVLPFQADCSVANDLEPPSAVHLFALQESLFNHLVGPLSGAVRPALQKGSSPHPSNERLIGYDGNFTGAASHVRRPDRHSRHRRANTRLDRKA